MSTILKMSILVAVIITITAGATLGVSHVLKPGKDKATTNLTQQIEAAKKDINQAEGSKEQEDLQQQLLALKVQLEKLQNSQQVKSTPKPSPAKATLTPSQSSSYKIILSASRYSLPADGETISFITAEVKDNNDKVVESFNDVLEFQTTAGVLIPNKVSAKNGIAFTELQSSTVPVNLSITAQSGATKSNAINLSFSAAAPPPPAANFDLNDSDIQAVVALVCPGDASGWGSGVIISSDGRILTNAHVENNAGSCDVYVAQNTQEKAYFKYEAVTVTRSENPDLAILRIVRDANGNSVSDLTIPYLDIGTSSGLKTGTTIMALGYPFYGSATATITTTKGIVSGFTSDYIKTDIKISNGNSGGPIINSDNQIIGIATVAFLGEVENLGGFISIDKIGTWAKGRGVYWPH